MDYLEWVQWPAMVATVVASWEVGSSREGKRNSGFWLFLLSNALWVAWGWHAKAYGVLALQFCLIAMNLRGLKKTNPDAK